MAIVVRFHPSSLTKETYDRVDRIVEEGDHGWPPEGLLVHVCFGEDGDLRVSEIWESREQFEAFIERLMPVLQEKGVEISV